MRSMTVLLVALAAPFTLTAPASADMPDWMSGDWSTSARLTAPDGARLRIRCNLEAAAPSATDWTGTLGCGTVQGRFSGDWNVAVSGANASGNVVFSGTENANLSISGTASDTRMDLSSEDGQGVAFAPGADGALIVEMRAMGPQRLTGTLTFEAR